MKGFGWSAEQRDVVRTHYGKLPCPAIARLVGRSESAVRNQAAQLGLVTGSHRPWTHSEIKLLRVLYATRGAVVASVRLGRSEASITKYAQQLGLQSRFLKRGLNDTGAKLWQPSEDDVLRRNYGRRPVEEIAKDLERSVVGVQKRASRISLSARGVVA